MIELVNDYTSLLTVYSIYGVILLSFILTCLLGWLAKSSFPFTDSRCDVEFADVKLTLQLYKDRKAVPVVSWLFKAVKRHNYPDEEESIFP
ncbi:hypothetical protein [Bacillus sp. Marseille-Q1617]|uniref:hypothetical protein n=1 Tax=Bacillus sp. Marseille-Q1617 TaxID=2736887 RepID=UPI00158E2BE9|nr:hypothetical protein [Bacillus sp. Marseille-Q1617]